LDLQLHNTLTRHKERFTPLDPQHVRMYVCGPTVYDYIHIGNARPIVVFDVLFRLLQHLYGAEQVKYARNITDVEDKINNRAREEGIPIEELTRRTTEAFHRDIADLKALEPTEEPRATGHIAEMIEIIEALIDKDHAYAADGHVLFSVPSDPNYGVLSGCNRDEMIAGARVEVARMLGHVGKTPGSAALRHSRRRRGPGLPTPRERDRPDHLRARHRLRTLLAA
jgi:cysteinyl-tRNA synthetase